MAAEKPKVCPLKMMGGSNSYAQDPFCEKEGCAWWLTFANDCCVPTIAGELADSTIKHEEVMAAKREAQQLREMEEMKRGG